MRGGAVLLERRDSFRAIALSEEAVAAAWENQLFGGELCLSSGERLQVVYRGRRNSDAGPDFRDAIIAVEGTGLLHGDVEIHVRASDWHSHGHSRDRRYDGVVLHVVMWDDVGHPTVLSSGATVPIFALFPLLKVSLSELREIARQKPLFEEPCSRMPERIDSDALRRLLDGAGQLRLASKAAVLEAAIACRGPEQALYEGLMEALGYSKNREPFQQLAQSLPLASLQGLLYGKRQADAARQGEAILLGVAGLLPSQRQQTMDTDYSAISPLDLEQDWKEYGGERYLTEEHWNFFRTRPENFPTRRIAGAARLIARSLNEGLVDYLLRPLDRPTPNAMRRALIYTLLIEDGLIGRGRSKVIVANVILPFALAYANLVGRPSLADRARWAYVAFPKLPSNAIVRQMSRQLFGTISPTIVDSASRQQGLHHIYKEFCLYRRCHGCLLAVGNHTLLRQ